MLLEDRKYTNIHNLFKHRSFVMGVAMIWLVLYHTKIDIANPVLNFFKSDRLWWCGFVFTFFWIRLLFLLQKRIPIVMCL